MRTRPFPLHPLVLVALTLTLVVGPMAAPVHAGPSDDGRREFPSRGIKSGPVPPGAASTPEPPDLDEVGPPPEALTRPSTPAWPGGEGLLDPGASLAETPDPQATGPGPRLDAAPARPVAPPAGPRRSQALPVAEDGTAVHYTAPHDGGVLRGFEEPDGPYGAGHRGVDLDAPAGARIVAAGHGVVRFAGEVAGQRWVTVEHPDGVLTTYGPLGVVAVRTGARVGRGELVGRLAAGGHGPDGRDEGLHWSARRDGVYVDPLTLLDGGVPRPTLVGPGGWRGRDPVVVPFDGWGGEVSRFGTRLEDSPDATRPGWAVAPNWHHLVVIPGLNSTSDDVPFDATLLGYDEDRTTSFSYTGCDPTPTGCDPRTYRAIDTHHGLERAAHDLADLLRQLRRANGGQPVDLVGHSQGGLVASYFLDHLYDPTDPSYPPIANLLTFATPFGGSPWADLGDSVSQSPAGFLFGGNRMHVAPETGTISRDPISISSPSIRDLQRSRGEQLLGLTDSPPIPTPPSGVRTLHLAGADDWVVPKESTAPEGGTYSVLPGGHSRVTSTEAAYETAHRFLSGREVERIDAWGLNALQGTVGSTAQDLALAVDIGMFAFNEIVLRAPGASLGPQTFEGSRMPGEDSQGRPIAP
ncbi:peptidoglycan DD-metalloendopeptidase family protein [Nitriliruptoraceae bacterium ZYF776]|nr:peptidoglycan DD-metalloendopeptidase family protein [Profundirhabdus halotolerans]